MPPVLARAGWRHGLRHPWQLALAVLGIALGVAVVYAVDLTRGSAERSFADATEVVVGRATHHLVGGPGGLDDVLYSELRRSGIRDVAPLIEARVGLADHDGAPLRMLGVDPVAEAPFRGYWRNGPGSEVLPLGPLMTRPGTALVSSATAERFGIHVGDHTAIAAGRLRQSLEIIGLLASDGRQPALAGSGLLIVDIATAQEALAMSGRLSRIDLILEEGTEAGLRKRLPPEVELIDAAARTESLAAMSSAFHTNLQALSLMALLVGLFLIYNSQTFMVVQRRRQFGVLRALGVTRGELARLVISEAAVLGFVGTLIGIGLGWLLAQQLSALVMRTLDDLYDLAPGGALTFDGPMLLKGLMLGLGGSLVASAVPAREAGAVEPCAALSRSDLEARAGAGARRALWVGLALALLGIGVLALPFRAVGIGFAGLFLVLVGLALTTPELMRVLSLRLAGSTPVRRSLAARLAVQGAAAALSRTGVAAAALMLAVATTIGIGVMVGSFRTSVDQWLAGVLRADYYLSPSASSASEAGTALDLDLAERLEGWPGVGKVSHVRHLELTGVDGITALAAFRLNAQARLGFQLIEGVADDAFWDRFDHGDAVLVTESFAWHRGLGVGDSLRLRTSAGEVTFPVIGIYRDYGSDRGRAAMSRETYDRHWPGDRAVSGIGLYVEPGFDEDALGAWLAESGQAIELVANGAIRKASLAVFDRTFTITEVLRLLAAVIAFIGVFSALLAIQLERTRELGVLKAVGMSAAQLRAMVLGETALVGAVAGLYAVPVGSVVALLLIQVINRRSFGWSMDLSLDSGVFLSGVLMALAAALLAGLYPAARMARLQPADALRME